MKKLMVVLMVVIFTGVNSMALAKGQPQTEDSKTNDKTTVGTKKPVTTKKPSVKKPVVKKTGGKGGAKDMSGGKNSPNGIITNGKPNTKNPKSAGDKQNGTGTANNPGL